MAKGPPLKDIGRVIYMVYLKHPEWKAKPIRDEIERRIRANNPAAKKGWPGLSAVQKALTKIRKAAQQRPPELKELDEPWSVIAMAQHPIPPEAVPLVLEVYMSCLEMPDKSFTPPTSIEGFCDWPYNVFTIREALWVGKLCKVGFLNKPIAQLTDDDLTILQAVVRTYASIERMGEISGEPFWNSRQEDRVLLLPLTGPPKKRDLKLIETLLPLIEEVFCTKFILDPAQWKKVRLLLDKVIAHGRTVDPEVKKALAEALAAKDTGSIA